MLTEHVMPDQLPDDARKSRVGEMGERLETQYRALRREVAVIQSNWQEYLELFGTLPHSAEALNQAGRRFLRTMQHEGWAACLLALARLTDIPKSAAQENLTIQTLPLLIEDPQTKTEVKDLVAVALAATEFCRDWRQQYITQGDSIPAVGGSLGLPRDTAKVNTALSAIVDVLNAIQRPRMNA
jgi:hypothetical protein